MTEITDEMLIVIAYTGSHPTTYFVDGVKYQTYSHDLAAELLQSRQDNAALAEKLKAAEEALQKIVSLDLKPYEKELLYGADKLKLIAYKALRHLALVEVSHD